MARNRYDIDEVMEDHFDLGQLKRLGHYVLPFKKDMFLAACLMLSASALTMLIPRFFMTVMNDIIPAGDIRGLFLISFYTLLIILYSVVSLKAKIKITNRVGQSVIHQLRQICCDPGLLFEGYAGGSAKMQLCLELIRNAAEGGHKVLLFSQFTSMLERLKQELVKEDISFYALDGSTPKLKRLELVESFNKDETQVFCISLKAGGTGLNLTAADIVIHFDPWWNVAVQNQATDRAHRIGQQNVVTVYKLIAKGTIEEKIVSLQEKKKELADKILGGEEMGMASFTKEELMDILRV